MNYSFKDQFDEVLNLCSSQLLDWHLQLDRSLPSPLGMVGLWLHQAEGALRQEITLQQAPEETANTVRRTLEQHKVSMEARKQKICMLLYMLCARWHSSLQAENSGATSSDLVYRQCSVCNISMQQSAHKSGVAD